MNTQLLRTEIVLHDEADLRTDLAKRAESQLGYSVLRRTLKVAGDLAIALQLLEIHPLDAVNVEAYKAEMAREKYRELRERMDRQQQNGWGVMQAYANWVRYELGAYQEPVPEYVLSKALEIKSLCPNVTFEVDALMVGYRTADPFLVAKLGDEQFYVEVWDEPKFEGEL